MKHFGQAELGYDLVNKIIAKTEAHWRNWNALSGPEGIVGCLKKYIQDLLPCELEAARELEKKRNELGKRVPDESKKAGTLVLLVGFSFEPLLQSVYAYRPDRVLLVLNDLYADDFDGQFFGGAIKELIDELPEHLLPKQPEVGALKINEITGVEQFVTQPATPQAVFQFLIDYLLRTQYDENGQPKPKPNPADVVIDITGAKKSMVTGAYLFGALTGCRLSYVDFDAYEPKKFRAYGYSCRIGAIANPYHTFQIANWQRVQERYEKYALSEAARLLDDIIKELKNEALFKKDETRKQADNANELAKEPKELGQLEKLREVIEFYGSWDAGDIPRAYGKWTSEIKAMGINAPMVVEVLGPKWQELEQNATTTPGPGDFAKSYWAMDKWATLLGTNQWHAMLTYVQDELAKIQRIFWLGDARAAFIRAANLHEYTLKFRLLILANIDDGIDVTRGDIFSVAFYKASLAILFSTDPNNDEFLQKFHERNRVRIQPSPILESLNLKMFTGWDTILFRRTRNGEQESVRLVDQFREVRNSTVHSLSVITKDDAERAVGFVEKDCDNLRDPWAQLLNRDDPNRVDLSQFVEAKTLRERRLGDTRFGLPLWKDLLSEAHCNIDFLPIFDHQDNQKEEPQS